MSVTLRACVRACVRVCVCVCFRARELVSSNHTPFRPAFLKQRGLSHLLVAGETGWRRCHLLDLFNTELFPERYWQEPRSQKVAEDRDYT